MTLGMVFFFFSFFGTLFGKSETKPILYFPVAESYHDEDYAFVRHFKPWLIAAVVAVVLAYVPPFYDIYKNNFKG